MQTLALPPWNKAQPLPATARLFIGLWPDSTTVARLQALAPRLLAEAQASGRALTPPHWHITLAYLGNNAAAQQPQQLPSLSLPKTLLLERLGVFETAQVLWLSAESEQLQQAHHDLWQWLTPLGWERENRGFVPHVSLLRRAQVEAKTLPIVESPIPWINTSLKLIVSMPQAQRSVYYEALSIDL